MEYRSLENEAPEAIHRCFRESFADYVVKVELPFEKYLRHIIRYGVELKYSVGSFHDDELVGFILNGVGWWKGRRTVYDAGTGLVKEHRGKGHSKKMFQALRQDIFTEDLSQYLLEVIQGNTPAHSLYAGLGFVEERELSCFKLEKEKLTKKEAAPALGLNFEPLPELDWEMLTGFWNFDPSWQNAIPAVERLSPYLKKLGAFVEGECVGYGIFDPLYGDIPQLAVKQKFRRKGIGSALLQMVAEGITEAPQLRVINVEKTDQETMEFFKAKNFENDVDQYEILLCMACTEDE